ncbi:MAG: hypothetical protein IJ629_02475 [Clostridia bacterium]|nr:hypothetical protein [Clostridia bacterium]
MKNKVLNFVEKFMLIVFLLLLVFYQTKHELWLDELDWSIGIVDAGNLIKVNEMVLRTGENLPLFYIILYIVKSIFGYHEWILTFLTATIFTILGTLGIIKISDKLLTKEYRIYTIFYIFISYSIMAQCGWQLRPYGLLFCCSSWMLYFWLQYREASTKKNFIKYTVSMILLMYSHWFGVLISLLYAVIDFILFLKKKCDWKFIISYMVAGLVFLPSFITLLKFHQSDIGNYGVEVPSFINIILIFRFLGGNLFINGLILVGTILILILDKPKEDKQQNALRCIGYITILLIILTYLYSRFINPQGSIIRNRYFSVLLPHAIILLSYGAISIIKSVSKNKAFMQIFKSFLVFYILLEVFVSYTYMIKYPNREGTSNYKTWAEYLYNQEEVYDDQTLIICTYGKTWVDYYFTYRDKKLPQNIIGIDPLVIPNQQHMAEEKVENFRYIIKDGKPSNDAITIEEIKEYDIVYYLEEYRTVSEEISEIFFSFDYETTAIEDAKLYKMEKVNEE